MKNVVIKAEKIHKFFNVKSQDVHILKGIDLEIKQGEFMIIFGVGVSGD